MLLQSFSGDFKVVSSSLWLECDVCRGAVVDEFRGWSRDSMLWDHYHYTFECKSIWLVGVIAQISPNEVKQARKNLFKAIAIGKREQNLLWTQVH